jgi:MoxR-like ATPase
VIRTTLTVLFAGGHLLLEDVPGVGKTMLSKTLARAIDGSVRRIQFTPDLLPSDVTGVSIFNQDTRTFDSGPGVCSPTSSSVTRSTGPPPRPSPRCWSAWRSGR